MADCVGAVLSQHSCSCVYAMGFPYVNFVCWHCTVVLVHQILCSLIACSIFLRKMMNIVLVTETWLCMRLNSKHHWVCEYSKRCSCSCICVQLTVLLFGLYHTVIPKLDTWSIFSMLLHVTGPVKQAEIKSRIVWDEKYPSRWLVYKVCYVIFIAFD